MSTEAADWLDYTLTVDLAHRKDSRSVPVRFHGRNGGRARGVALGRDRIDWRTGNPTQNQNHPDVHVDIEDPSGAAYIRRRLAEVHGLDPRGGVVFTRQTEGRRKRGMWLIEDMNGVSAWVLKDSPIPTDQITLALAHAAKRWLTAKGTP